jgi:hypothetical protein
MNKDEILDRLEDEREKFMEAIEGLPAEALHEPGVVGDWSVKDVIAHLSMWEAELVRLLWQAAHGEKPTTLHFEDIDVDTLNKAWQEQVETRSLEQILEDFRSVREQTERRVSAFSDQDLEDAKRYPWLGGAPLWQWIENDSFGHEAEHIEQIRAWRHKTERH